MLKWRKNNPLCLFKISCKTSFFQGASILQCAERKQTRRERVSSVHMVTSPKDQIFSARISLLFIKLFLIATYL